MANGFNTSNRASFVSSAITNQNQGGGVKKAGFPYIIGRTQWTNIALQTNNNGASKTCNCSLKSLQFTKFPNVRQSRPVWARTDVVLR